MKFQVPKAQGLFLCGLVVLETCLRKEAAMADTLYFEKGAIVSAPRRGFTSNATGVLKVGTLSWPRGEAPGKNRVRSFDGLVRFGGRFYGKLSWQYVSTHVEEGKAQRVAKTPRSSPWRLGKDGADD